MDHQLVMLTFSLGHGTWYHVAIKSIFKPLSQDSPFKSSQLETLESQPEAYAANASFKLLWVDNFSSEN